MGELDALVQQHPHDERLRARQMLSLYHAGRQADALDAYRAAYEALTDGLGIEPSAELRSLRPRSCATTSPPRRRRRSRRCRPTCAGA